MDFGLPFRMAEPLFDLQGAGEKHLGLAGEPGANVDGAHFAEHSGFALEVSQLAVQHERQSALGQGFNPLKVEQLGESAAGVRLRLPVARSVGKADSLPEIQLDFWELALATQLSRCFDQFDGFGRGRFGGSERDRREDGGEEVAREKSPCKHESQFHQLNEMPRAPRSNAHSPASPLPCRDLLTAF
jgi:hypothetical protein